MSPMVKKIGGVFSALLIALSLILSACSTPTPGPAATLTPSPTQTQYHAFLPSATITPVPTPTFTPTVTSTIDPAHPWLPFPGPQTTSAAPIPPPFPALSLPDEVQSLVLMGTDTDAPFVGRTDAILLVLYHPRLGRASVISLPPDLMVYIPGFTMQRLNTAYALGGEHLLRQTILYNFGIRPDHWAVVHLDSFTTFIDSVLGGLDVNVVQGYPNPKFCGGIPTGVFHMTGAQVLCYVTFRLDTDEADRNRRQQEVFRAILLRMLRNGHLSRLPDMVNFFEHSVETDLTLGQLTADIPLALELGDPAHLALFHFSDDELKSWVLKSAISQTVFMPNRTAIGGLLANAAGFIQTPAPLSDIVLTEAYELTNVPTLTSTGITTPTSTRTITPLPTLTFTPSRTPTITLTPTITPTGPTATPSPTGPTPTGPTPTPSLTSTPSPSASPKS